MFGGFEFFRLKVPQSPLTADLILLDTLTIKALRSWRTHINYIIIIIIIIIKSLFIGGTGISKHKCVKSRLKTYMQQPTEHSSSAVGPSQIIK